MYTLILMKVGSLARGKVRFYVYARDHSPPHVHALTVDGEALVDIRNGEVLGVDGISKADLRILVRWVLARTEFLLVEWESLHEESRNG